ncbi:MAG: agmatinase [Thermoproteota archaeon]
MDEARLYLVENPYFFSGIRCSYEESWFAVVGVPFDGTTSFRPGSRFGPASIRLFSAEAETISLDGGVDLQDVRVSDLGDVSVTFNVDEVLKRVGKVCGEIRADSKIPVILGGEHTITLGAARSLRPETIVSFDAHFDYRDEYPEGVRVSHATVMRRIREEACRVVHVGVRAACREEVEYAGGETFFSSRQVLRNPEEACRRLRSIVENAGSIYVSIDLDVLDPAYAPGVANPEACGIPTSILLDLLENTVSEKLVGLDLVELNPLLDPGSASAAAAVRILFEAISRTARRKKLV